LDEDFQNSPQQAADFSGVEHKKRNTREYRKSKRRSNRSNKNEAIHATSTYLGDTELERKGKKLPRATRNILAGLSPDKKHKTLSKN
jgi:hypothetical protein